MHLILISNCLRGLDAGRMSTSSEKFEYEFASNLSCHLPVIAYSSVIDVGSEATQGRLSLRGYAGPNPIARIKSLFELLRGQGGEAVIVFFGYDLFLVLSLLLVKLRFQCVVAAFIFDSHLGAIRGYPPPKAFLANGYFRLSIALLNLFDGFLLFRGAAARELKLRRPFIITRPGIDASTQPCTLRLEQHPFVVTYAGSLMEYNGIRELLAAFALSSDPDLRLRLFGVGELQSMVEGYCRNDSRVYYGGLVDQSQVRSELCSSNLLVSLRDSSDCVSRFAFPSKLVEFLGSAVPVMSTDLDFDDDLKRCLYLVESLDPREVLRSIEEAKSAGFECNASLGMSARTYVLDRNHWPNVCAEVVDFLKTIAARLEPRSGSARPYNADTSSRN